MSAKPVVRLSHYGDGRPRWVIVLPKGYWVPELMEGPTTPFPGHRSYGFCRDQAGTMDAARQYINDIQKENQA